MATPTPTADQIAQLRRMVAEPDANTYSTTVLSGIIVRYPLVDADGNDPDDLLWAGVWDLNRAAADIWEEKATAYVADFDFAADGGDYKRSQAHAQMLAMDSAPYAEQAKGLDEFLSDPQKAVKQMGDMHAWWRAGDVDKLDREMRVEMAKDTPETYRLLNVARNDAWMPAVEKRLTESKKDDTLVVVGTLHLLGEDGLVEKLRAKGYTVERVCDACAAPAAE